MQFRTRKMIMPMHLNGAGNLFGGQALAWVDEEAAVYAACQLGDDNLVTKFMSSIDFKAPAKRGDVVEIGCDIVSFGRTSITVTCTMRNKTTKENILVVDKIVFVALDDNGAPRVHNVNTVREG